MQNFRYKGLVILSVILFIVVIAEVLFYANLNKAKSTHNTQAKMPSPTPIDTTLVGKDPRSKHNYTKAVNMVAQIYDYKPTSALVSIEYTGTIDQILPYIDTNSKNGMEIIIQPRIESAPSLPLFLTNDDLNLLIIKDIQGKILTLNDLKNKQKVKMSITHDILEDKTISMEIEVQKN